MPVVDYRGGVLDFRLGIDQGTSASKTAAMIWDWLKQPGRDYDALVLPNGINFGQMLTEHDQTSADSIKGREQYNLAFNTTVMKRPCALWNAQYEFEYFGDVLDEDISMNLSGDITVKPPNVAGGYVYQVPRKGFGPLKTRVIRVTAGKMPAWLVLFHELGHVKQYFEAGDAQWKIRLGDTNKIEADNLDDHEWPMCRDIGIPVRKHYKHNIFGFESIRKTYSAPTKAGAWKAASSKTLRVQLEADLKAEADRNAVDKPATGIYHAPGI